MTSLGEKSMNILPEIFFYQLGNQIFPAGENLLYSSAGCSSTKTVHVDPHYSFNFEDGPDQIYFWEAYSYREGYPLANYFNRI